MSVQTDPVKLHDLLTRLFLTRPFSVRTLSLNIVRSFKLVVTFSLILSTNVDMKLP